MATTEQIDRLIAFLGDLKVAKASGRKFEAQGLIGSEWKRRSLDVYSVAIDHRIVYQPREVWANVYECHGPSYYDSRESADQSATKDRIECVHYCED